MNNDEFERFVLKFGKDILRFCRMTAGDAENGDELYQDTMPKLRAIRGWIDERGLDCELEVDGGIDPVTCKTVTASGANVLVAGSSVYKAADIPGRIQELRG